jgi:hypothetical protein
MSDSASFKENVKQLNVLKNQLSTIKANLVSQKSQLPSLQQGQKKNLEDKQLFVQQLSEVSQKLSVCNESEKPMYEGQKLRLVQEQKLVTDREIAIKKHISWIDTNIQSINQQEADCLTQLQKTLKNTFFTMRQTLDEYSADTRPLTRFLLLQSLKDTIGRESLSPHELDDLKDRDYADGVINCLKETFDSSNNSITTDEKKDLQKWKELLLAIASTSQTVHSKENNLDSLPTMLDRAKKDLEQFQQQHNDGEQKRHEYKSQSMISFTVMFIAICAIFVLPPFFLLAFAALVYGVIKIRNSKKLDYTKNIQSLQKECARLESEIANMPNVLASLETDKNSLLHQQQELSKICVRHPELSDFRLPQF